MFIKGVWGVGLATSKCPLDYAPLGADGESWVLRDDGTLWHANKLFDALKNSQLQESDVIVSDINIQIFFLFLFIVKYLCLIFQYS